MLAIEVVFAGADPVPTFVFDEVDAGVGGKAAVEVGRRLARLARSAQVHRGHPPAAGRGVRRPAPGGGEGRRRRGRPRSGVTAPRRRRAGSRELSRMLAGLEDSELGRAHAEELLAAAARNGATGRTGLADGSARQRRPGRCGRRGRCGCGTWPPMRRVARGRGWLAGWSTMAAVPQARARSTGAGPTTCPASSAPPGSTAAPRTSPSGCAPATSRSSTTSTSTGSAPRRWSRCQRRRRRQRAPSSITGATRTSGPRSSLDAGIPLRRRRRRRAVRPGQGGRPGPARRRHRATSATSAVAKGGVQDRRVGRGGDDRGPGRACPSSSRRSPPTRWSTCSRERDLLLDGVGVPEHAHPDRRPARAGRGARLPLQGGPGRAAPVHPRVSSRC